MQSPDLPEQSTIASDTALVTRLREGDSHAFDLLIQRHWKPLVHYLAARTADRDTARDLAQETCIRVWQRRRALRPEGSVRGYLYRIARNLAVDEGRRAERQERLATSSSSAASYASARDTPFDVMQRRETLRILEKAVAALSARRREAFTLVHIHGMSYRESAEVMGVSVQTVANHVAAGLSDLRRRLRPVLGACDDE